MRAVIGQKKIDLNGAYRDLVMTSYNAAEAENRVQFIKGNKKATSEYIYENQKIDALNIVNEFYIEKRRVVSITKKTKVGADGLMIQVAKLMTTHPDDDFMVNPENVRILTGMSNVSWEKDMKDKAPGCQKEKIFHHGQLKHSDLTGLSDALIIIDELDTGDKECQVLHTTLKDAGVLDVQYMKEKNIRFIFISATMVKELYELYKWGDLHCLYKMTIPHAYIGHAEFLEKEIIKEFYPLNTNENADRWVKEDIIDYYGTDNRVHIVRATLKTDTIIQNACIRNGIMCRNHTSSDKIEDDILSELFESPLTRHVVLIVKGFFRRANLIPNEWKMRIGATHELYTKQVDNNVQIQGLPGRMSGYWRDAIEAGHKTGPYRTSIKAVEQYESTYEDPFGHNSYQTAGFKKTNGKIKMSTPVLVTPKNIAGLVPTDGPSGADEPNDVKMNVPIVIPIANAEIDRIHGLRTELKRKALLAILKDSLRANNNAVLASRLDGFAFGQINRPDTENSRKKGVDDPAKAALENRPYSVNVKDKSKDSWQAALDDRGNRVIFMIYCTPNPDVPIGGGAPI
jgi:hypothetical protein